MRMVGPRRMLHEAADFLSSRAISFWVMGAWVALAVVWVLPFQLTGQPETTVANIATTWLPFRIAYGALLAMTTVCGLLRFVRDLKRAQGPLPVGRPLPSEPLTCARGTLEEAGAVLDSMGFETARADDRVVGVNRRWSLLGGSFFHLSVPLVAAGLLLHAVSYGSIQFRLIEGQSADHILASVTAGEGRWEPLVSAAASRTLESVEPSFYEDVLLFERLDAVVTDDRTGSRDAMSLASPLWLDAFTIQSIQDFGLAPVVELVDAEGRVVEEVIAALDVFPPGAQDRVRLPVNGVTVSMVVYPDHGIVAGRDVSKSYNLRNPRILAGVEQDFPAGMVQARKLVKVGETVPGSDPMVRISEIRRSGTFKVWRSYGWPLLAFSALLMLTGLTARILLPRREVVVWRHSGGLGMTARIDGRTGAAGVGSFLAAVADGIERRAAAETTRPDGGGDTG